MDKLLQSVDLLFISIIISVVLLVLLWNIVNTINLRRIGRNMEYIESELRKKQLEIEKVKRESVEIKAQYLMHVEENKHAEPEYIPEVSIVTSETEDAPAEVPVKEDGAEIASPKVTVPVPGIEVISPGASGNFEDEPVLTDASTLKMDENGESAEQEKEICVKVYNSEKKRKDISRVRNSVEQAIRINTKRILVNFTHISYATHKDIEELKKIVDDLKPHGIPIQFIKVSGKLREILVKAGLGNLIN